MTKRITILILVLTPWAVVAQSVTMKNSYHIEGSNIVLYLDGSWSRSDQEKLLEQCGMKGLPLDTLWQFGKVGTQWAKDGWKATRSGKNGYKIYKSLSNLSGDLKWDKDVVLLPGDERLRQQTFAVYGSNSFKKVSVLALKNGGRRFILYGKPDARQVLLSGTFNNWSTLGKVMTKTDSGWIADVMLPPGKHCYKFIVDGRWMNDPQNSMREDDYHDGFNSVYFMTNYEFKLKGYEQAREVIVTGSFNNWNERELRLRKTSDGWRLPVYLNTGTHSYKFIVDKQWINDPANPLVRDDGQGNKNSYVHLGEPLTFSLNGFTTAKKVIVAGDFNQWNENELVMTRTTTGWQLPYVLGAGNHQYKFIVDGQWMTDPKNPHIGTIDGHTNSILVIKGNYTFTLKGFTNAKDVQVAGNFNS
jgi:1,4-alpha-glucan branching enzyme